MLIHYRHVPRSTPRETKKKLGTRSLSTTKFDHLGLPIAWSARRKKPNRFIEKPRFKKRGFSMNLF